MLTVRLDKQLEEQVAHLAKIEGRNRSAIVREAIIRYLEDKEDLALARQALDVTTGSKPLRQLRKELGLDG